MLTIEPQVKGFGCIVMDQSKISLSFAGAKELSLLAILLASSLIFHAVFREVSLISPKISRR